MKLEEAQRWLSEIKYKDYVFTLDEDPDRGVVLYCIRQFEDSITGKKGPRHTDYPMEISNMDASAFVHKIFGFMLGLEQHEVCEFFKFKDVAIFNPHADVFALRYTMTQTLKKLDIPE